MFTTEAPKPRNNKESKSAARSAVQVQNKFPCPPCFRGEPIPYFNAFLRARFSCSARNSFPSACG